MTRRQQYIYQLDRKAIHTFQKEGKKNIAVLLAHILSAVDWHL